MAAVDRPDAARGAEIAGARPLRACIAASKAQAALSPAQPTAESTHLTARAGRRFGGVGEGAGRACVTHGSSCRRGEAAGRTRTAGGGDLRGGEGAGRALEADDAGGCADGSCILAGTARRASSGCARECAGDALSAGRGCIRCREQASSTF